VSHRPPHDDELIFSIWNRKRSPLVETTPPTVLVAHSDLAVGESIAVLLRCEGFSAIHCNDANAVRLMLECWTPGAVLIDTRMDRANSLGFVQDISRHPGFANVLLVAMTRIFIAETPGQMKQLGYDGLCRTPCPVWKLADMLRDHFTPQH
jgi:DNA-binding NtrC family response regulator